MSPWHNHEPTAVARARSRLLSIKPSEWMHLSPLYTHMHGEWLGMQNLLAKFLLSRDDWDSQVKLLYKQNKKKMIFC